VIALAACAQPATSTAPADAGLDDAMPETAADAPRDVFIDVPPDVRYLRCEDLERVYGCRGTIRACFPNNPNGVVGLCNEPVPYSACAGSTGGPYCRTGDQAWNWQCLCHPTSMASGEGVWNCKVQVVCEGDASVWPR
jgi:hypothetical protein